ncbi:hypothetical protein I4U23_011753 [Adineta vaga]|nr:hypothetical protein I4U23_011753 [Adineta vaga]
MNSTEINYLFYSYIPSRYAASIFAAILYLSSIAWFIQTLYSKCRPHLLGIFIFLSHLTTFIELVLRATLTIDILNTQILYRITAALASSSPRLLLLANYRCLVDLRGKRPHQKLDRVYDIIIPLSVLIMDSLLCIADELLFDRNYEKLSIHFRQVSNGFSFSLALFFYLLWYLTVSPVRRLYMLPLITISSVCVLIEISYTFFISIPVIFRTLTKNNEFFYYICHVIPLFLALISWTIFHPSRLLPPSEASVPRDASGNELLPLPPSD